MLAVGHLIWFDDIDLQEDWFGAMSRPSQQQLGFLLRSDGVLNGGGIFTASVYEQNTHIFGNIPRSKTPGQIQ